MPIDFKLIICVLHVPAKCRRVYTHKRARALVRVHSHHDLHVSICPSAWSTNKHYNNTYLWKWRLPLDLCTLSLQYRVNVAQCLDTDGKNHSHSHVRWCPSCQRSWKNESCIRSENKIFICPHRVPEVPQTVFVYIYIRVLCVCEQWHSKCMESQWHNDS